MPPSVFALRGHHRYRPVRIMMIAHDAASSTTVGAAIAHEQLAVQAEEDVA